MTVEELLLQLQDIQPPPEPPWWLLAPVYWSVIGSFAAIAVCTWVILRYRKANRLASLAERALKHISATYRRDQDSRNLAIELSKWLKQVSILAFPAQRLESLSGERWLEFLDDSIGNNSFSHGDGQVFGTMVYSKQVRPDADQLLALCNQWLTAVKPQLRQRSRD